MVCSKKSNIFPAGGKVIFASGNLISLDCTEKRFLDFSFSNEVSLKVRGIWDMRETLRLFCPPSLEMEKSRNLFSVGTSEIRLPEAKIVLKGRWVYTVGNKVSRRNSIEGVPW